MKSSHGKIILFFAILWVAGGCATQTRLEPASVGVTESTFDVGIGSYKGVRLIADPDAWRGIPEVTEKVTPIKITVENNYGTAIRVLYPHFVLVGEYGTRFSALPAFDIDEKIRTSEPASSTRAPALRSHYFFVSPHHHANMPGLPSTREPFPYDPLYYKRYHHGKWKEIALPTEHMKAVVLPEGDIHEQGIVTGFIYFEKVREVEHVELHMDLMEAEDGTIFGRIRVPFIVIE